MVMSALRSFATNKVACCILAPAKLAPIRPKRSILIKTITTLSRLAPTIKANGINFIAFIGLSGF